LSLLVCVKCQKVTLKKERREYSSGKLSQLCLVFCIWNWYPQSSWSKKFSSFLFSNFDQIQCSQWRKCMGWTL